MKAKMKYEVQALRNFHKCYDICKYKKYIGAEKMLAIMQSLSNNVDELSQYIINVFIYT